MICPQCNHEAAGRFCGNCGGATDPKTPLEVANAVDQPGLETSMIASSGKPGDANEVPLQGFSSPMPPAGWFPDTDNSAQLRSLGRFEVERAQESGDGPAAEHGVAAIRHFEPKGTVGRAGYGRSAGA
jgi:hypothetical protein